MDEVKSGGELPPDQPRTSPDNPLTPAPAEVLPPAIARGGGGATTPPPPSPPGDDDDDEEEGGMLRMSFLEHLEELRSRIIRALGGFGVIFLLCVVFSNQLFDIVMAPGFDAIQKAGGTFAALKPMERFSIMWMWT